MTMMAKDTGTPILIEAEMTAVRLALDKCGNVSLANQCHLNSRLTSTTSISLSLNIIIFQEYQVPSFVRQWTYHQRITACFISFRSK